jgi:S1-C subfamily serine protease
MTDQPHLTPNPSGSPASAGGPTRDLGADALAAQVSPRPVAPAASPDAGTQPVAWTPAASVVEPGPATGAAPAATPPPAPVGAPAASFASSAMPAQGPAPATAPAADRRRAGVGPAVVVGAMLVTAVLTSAGTYLAVSAANDTDDPATAPAGQVTTSTPAPATPAPAETTPAPAAGQKSIVDIVKDVSPAVVTIVAEGVQQESILGGGQGAATGSGVIFDADGLVLTNRHVVSGNPSKITVNLKDGRSLAGSIYGIDTYTDLAIVKVEGSNLPTAPIGDSSAIQVGQEAIAIGSPLGEFTDSVTSGIISAIGRSIDVQDGTRITNLIQTDTAINPGNSGGPLLDRSGAVIGINTAIAGGAQGIGFAIPIDIAKPLLAQASNGQELARAWLGIRFQTIDAALKEEANLPVDQGAWIPTSTAAANGGARPAPSDDPAQRENPFGLTPEQLDELFRQFGIDPDQLPQGQLPGGGQQGLGGTGAAQPSIVAGSPAEQAGLAEGDVITAINGTTLTATTPLDLVVSQLAPGQAATLDVLRNGQELTVTVTLGTRPADL